MNRYTIKITADIPYPWTRTYTQEATGEGAAVSRALKAYRQDIRDRSGGKSKRISSFTCSISRLSNLGEKSNELQEEIQ